MARRQRQGLDELMIVNPGTPAATHAVILRRTRTVDRLSGVEDDEHRRGDQARRRARGRFFLGADGALYELIE